MDYMIFSVLASSSLFIIFVHSKSAEAQALTSYIPVVTEFWAGQQGDRPRLLLPLSFNVFRAILITKTKTRTKMIAIRLLKLELKYSKTKTTLWFKKNAPTLADYNNDPVQSILIIFSKLFANDHKSCLVVKFSTSPHICWHYTLWNTMLYFALITLLIAKKCANFG